MLLFVKPVTSAAVKVTLKFFQPEPFITAPSGLVIRAVPSALQSATLNCAGTPVLVSKLTASTLTVSGVLRATPDKVRLYATSPLPLPATAKYLPPVGSVGIVQPAFAGACLVISCCPSCRVVLFVPHTKSVLALSTQVFTSPVPKSSVKSTLGVVDELAGV